MENESDSRRTGQVVEGVLTAKPHNLGYDKDVDCRLMKKFRMDYGAKQHYQRNNLHNRKAIVVLILVNVNHKSRSDCSSVLSINY